MTAILDEPDEAFGPEWARLDDRWVLVTGAARGLGRAIALGAARFGANVVAIDRDELGVTSLRDGVESLGRSCLTGVCDVRNRDAVDAVLEEAMARTDGLDVLVNNAGGGFFAPFLDVSPGGEAALIAENFTQVTHLIRSCVPHLVPGGSIVSVTSIEGHRAGPGFAIYSAMKAAVENLTRTLALELADRRIRVNAVAPDMIPTPGDDALADEAGALADDNYSPHPWPDSGTPDDAAAAVIFLASDMARFITGSTIHLDGGTSAAAGWRRRRSDGAWLL
ncbi:MAG: SDR family oxidoreductase [Microthrixaceae bacterium]